MKTAIISFLIAAIGLWLGSELLPDVSFPGGTSAILISAFLLGLANAFVKPIVTVLTLPLTVITLGLFLLVVNGLMILLVDALVTGFAVEGLGSAILLAIVVAVVNALVGAFVK